MGSKAPVTLADVARAAGVAKSTASHVFAGSDRVRESTAAKVRAAAAELGYTGPSAMGRAFARGTSHVVAIMTTALLGDEDTDPFALDIFDGIQREFAQLGYAIVILPPVVDDASRALADSVVFDAVLTVRRITGFDITDAYLSQRGVPWLSLDGFNNEQLAVMTDDAAAIAEILDHLVGLGHQRIAAVTLLFDPARPDHEFVDFDEITAASHPNIRRRLDGFVRAGVTPQVVYKCGVVDFENGYQAGLALLDLPEPPTAVVCMADTHAAGVIHAARERGVRVPEDLSVTGFDGLPLARLSPVALTTVIQDGVSKGRASARYLAGVMDGAPPEPEQLPLTVRIGNTTGPVPISPN